MSSYNKVILIGNLVRDPEIRYVSSGSAVAKFTIAVNSYGKKDDAIFVDIVAWEKLGETCNTYLKKGSSVLVEGRLSIRKYDDKDGNKRTATEIVANTMEMLNSKPQNSSDGQARRTSEPKTEEALEELPF